MKMLDEGLISSDFKYKDNALFNRMGGFDYLNCARQPFPQPLIYSSDSYVIDSVILAINPNTPNIEAAKKYLEYSISLPVLQRRTSDYLLKDRDLYEFSWGFHEEMAIILGRTLEEHLEEIGIAKEPTTNGHDVLAFMYKNSKPRYFNLDIFNEMDSESEALRSRTMTPEEFAEKLYKKSKMIIEE
jgi:hypothetical protein